MNNRQDISLPKLVEGYKRFQSKHFENSKVYDDLVSKGQKPKALVIACCDSRVDPAIVTDCDPGEIFVVRNVANLVPPFESDLRHHGTSAALEFAVKSLAVSDIIIFGHSHCGGIQALMGNKDGQAPQDDFLTAWMDIATKAKEQVLSEHAELSLEEKIPLCEQASLLISLQNLQTFPWIKARVEQGKLALHAWYFDLGRGAVEAYDPSRQRFFPLDEI